MKLLDYRFVPVISEPAKHVTPDDLKLHNVTTVPAMLEHLKTGIAGLTGPAVGLNLRFFVTKYPTFSFCANPLYEDVVGSDWTARYERSPMRKWQYIVRRCENIEAHFTDLEGTEQMLALTGNEARVFAHFTDSVMGWQIWDNRMMPTY